MTQDYNMPAPANISVVDDDEAMRIALNSLLRSHGYSVKTYDSAQDFLCSDGPGQTHCLVSDIQMPGMRGIEMYEALAAMGYTIPVIFITAYARGVPPLRSGTPEPIACLPKPFRSEQLIDYIEVALSGSAGH
ncbi:response regulator [Pseudomonas sp. X10]